MTFVFYISFVSVRLFTIRFLFFFNVLKENFNL
jgi:hypothetical protein